MRLCPVLKFLPLATVAALALTPWLTGCEDDAAPADTSAPDTTEGDAADTAAPEDVAPDSDDTADTAAPDTTPDVAPDVVPDVVVECPEPTGARPKARAEHTGIYDPIGHNVVLFGGSFGVPQNCSAIVNHTYESDTWLFDTRCNQWREVTGAAPVGRTRASAVYDSKNHRMLLYGGRSRSGSSGPYTLYPKVEAFDLATETWSQLTTTGDPAPRFNHAAAYDAANHRMLVFGGNTSTSGTVYTDSNDVFSLDLASGAWSKVTPAAGDKPAKRFWVSGLWDEKRSWFVVFGGSNAAEVFDPSATYYQDLWALDFAQDPPVWYQLDTELPRPMGRFWAGFVRDAAKDRYVMFGGHDDQQLGNRNDLWSFDLSTLMWSAIETGDAFNKPANGFCDFPPDFAVIDPASPERRHAHVFVAGEGKAFTTGGKTDCGNVDDVFALDLTTDSWTEAMGATVGEACLRKGGVGCNDMCF